MSNRTCCKTSALQNVPIMRAKPGTPDIVQLYPPRPILSLPLPPPHTHNAVAGWKGGVQKAYVTTVNCHHYWVAVPKVTTFRSPPQWVPQWIHGSAAKQNPMAFAEICDQCDVSW